ncbi:single-stranded DNA-binding protein [Microbacterium sp. MC2]
MKERITVVGNIATVPEQRKLGSGDTVVNFRLAANHGHWDRGAGKWVDGEASFYAVSAYRALGEHALASLHRGERVIVTGTFRVREWDTGQKQGMAAEIDAEALGHDLRWGTSLFRRAQPTSEKTGEREDAVSDGSPAAWQAPEAEASDAPASDAPEWAAVPAGGATVA